MFHVFSLYALILAVYLCASLIVPLPLAKRWKALLCIPLLLAALKNEVLYFFGGPMFFAPELPGWFLIALSIAFNILLMLFFLTLLKDLVLTALWIINRFRGGKVPFFRPGRGIRGNCRPRIISWRLGNGQRPSGPGSPGRNACCPSSS